MADPKAPLGSTEIEILRYIGDHHPISVGEAAEHVAQTTGQARTTVLTIMERLRRKGYLTRRHVGGVYRYSPKIPKHDLLRGLVKHFVDTTLGGSMSPFLAFLSEGRPISEKDMETLKRVLRDMEHRRKGVR
jgi:predicted transcriptional regulator